MKLLSLSLATVATSLVVVPASLVSAGTNLNDTGITNITKIPAGAGPLDLGDVYQRLSVSLAGQGAASYSPIVYHSNTAAGVITNNPSFFFFTTPVGQTLPVYVIYWGTGFTNTQTILIKTFLTGIGSHPYWNIVKSYSVSGWTAATVSFGGSCQTPYYPAAPGGVQAISGSGNNLVMFNEQAILSDLLTKGNLVKKKTPLTRKRKNICLIFSHLIFDLPTLPIISALWQKLRLLC